MLYELIKPYRSIAMIGMCKNAGKTTVLNRLIADSNRAGEVIGLTSIGRDGESSDIVTNTKKPKIFVWGGTLFATAQQALPLGSVSKKIMDVTDMSTPMGNVIICKAMSDGFVQLAGPSMTVQLGRIRDELFQLGAERVFLDGALSRKSLSMPFVSDASVLCSGASFSPDLKRTVENTAYYVMLMSIKKTKWDFSSINGKFAIVTDGEIVIENTLDEAVDELRRRKTGALLMRGGVTDAMARVLLSGGRFGGNIELVVEDGSRLLLSKQNYDKLFIAGANFGVINETNLLAVTVNPFSAYGTHYNKSEFFDAVRQRVPDNVAVVNVLEEDEC